MKRLAGLAVVLLLLAGGPARAGQTEEQKIEAAIAAMLDAYQKGDFVTMGRYHAADVTVVPGDYTPPVHGWDKVLQRYQRAAANFTRLDIMRENTQIVRRGNFAWATYEWRLAGAMGKEVLEAQGHTTLVLEKRKGNWVIVHNHTSAVALPAGPAPPTPAPSAPPTS